MSDAMKTVREALERIDLSIQQGRRCFAPGTARDLYDGAFLGGREQVSAALTAPDSLADQVRAEAMEEAAKIADAEAESWRLKAELFEEHYQRASARDCTGKGSVAKRVAGAIRARGTP